MAKEIDVIQLKEWLDKGVDFQLIDVREPYEYEIANIGGEQIPIGDIPHSIPLIEKDKNVVIYCRSGKRSADIIQYLQIMHGFDNLYNLKGGILAWSDEIDPTVTKY